MFNEYDFGSNKSRQITAKMQGELKFGQPCLMHVQLGPAYQGEDTLHAVPSRWRITSASIEFVSVHPEVEVTVDESGEKPLWVAEFDLLYPVQEASEVVPIQLIPRAEEMCEMDIDFTCQEMDRHVELSFRPRR